MLDIKTEHKMSKYKSSSQRDVYMYDHFKIPSSQGRFEATDPSGICPREPRKWLLKDRNFNEFTNAQVETQTTESPQRTGK